MSKIVENNLICALSNTKEKPFISTNLFSDWRKPPRETSDCSRSCDSHLSRVHNQPVHCNQAQVVHVSRTYSATWRGKEVATFIPWPKLSSTQI